MEKIKHIACTAVNINKAVEWYKENTDCKVKEQSKERAILEYENIDLHLVDVAETPAHLAFEDDKLMYGEEEPDGTIYTYIHDGFTNMIKKIKYPRKNKK
tara:strand:+ start:565 stop:864 length:300 start_codon:yes stop_codon:yes gene_type:complete